MKRDISLFSPDVIIEVSGEDSSFDTSHIYSGEIFGKSSCFHTPHPEHRYMSVIKLWYFYLHHHFSCYHFYSTLSLQWLFTPFKWRTFFTYSIFCLFVCVWQKFKVYLKFVFITVFYHITIRFSLGSLWPFIQFFLPFSIPALPGHLPAACLQQSSDK